MAGGDANADNSVDRSDFATLVAAYNSDATIAETGYDPNADFNYDGLVDAADFGILVGEFGRRGAL